MQDFYIAPDASNRTSIWFKGHCWEKGFPNLKKLFKQQLGAKSAYRLFFLPEDSETSMSYDKGSFCIDVDNWFTIVRPQSNIEIVLRDLATALIASGEFQQVEAPEGNAS